MPNLQKLVERGVMGNITTLYPVLSPMLWRAIAAGNRFLGGTFDEVAMTAVVKSDLYRYRKG